MNGLWETLPTGARHYKCEQGSPEWYFARRGIPTASEFKRIMTQTRFELSEGADEYINDLIGETQSERLPESVENYTSRAMRFGQETEAEARIYFERNGLEARKCGFILSPDGRYGCSPDALVYADGELVGGLELKCPTEKVHTRYLRGGVLPNDHRGQVHGGMIATVLQRWWFMSYCPFMGKLKSFETSVVPDTYTSSLKKAVDEFCDRYDNAKAALGI